MPPEQEFILPGGFFLPFPECYNGTMEALDGKKIAAAILGRLAPLPVPKKFFGAVLVGDDASSVSFLAQKEKIARQLGVDFRLYRFPVTVKNDELRREVGKIAEHKTCGGVIVQLPLPDHLNPHYILNAVPPEKDVDVLGERALGSFYVGRSAVLPPAVGVMEEIFAERRIVPAEHAVAIVGLGLLVGRPIANWIMRRAKQTILLRRTSDIGLLCHADIVVLGTGRAGLVSPDLLKEKVGVIDFGYGTIDGKYSGDFDVRTLADGGMRTRAGSWYTPTPGGTGPILVAKLFENFYRLNA